MTGYFTTKLAHLIRPISCAQETPIPSQISLTGDRAFGLNLCAQDRRPTVYTLAHQKLKSKFRVRIFLFGLVEDSYLEILAPIQSDDSYRNKGSSVHGGAYRNTKPNELPADEAASSQPVGRKLRRDNRMRSLSAPRPEIAR